MTETVIDASAILALAFGEPGSEMVRHRLAGGIVSAVNYSEAVGRSIDRGVPLEQAAPGLARLDLTIIPFDAAAAALAASLRSAVRLYGLSFADRACLALALCRNLPVLTADRAWSRLDVGLTVTCIR